MCEIPKTVLVVEEDRQLRQLIGRILDSAGYHVLQASTRHSAFALLGSIRDVVDLVVVDPVQSPSPSEYGRKVLLLAFDPAAGPDSSILPKPFKPAALVAAVQRVLG